MDPQIAHFHPSAGPPHFAHSSVCVAIGLFTALV
jgi:hypothetical protein